MNIKPEEVPIHQITVVGIALAMSTARTSELGIQVRTETVDHCDDCNRNAGCNQPVFYRGRAGLVIQKTRKNLLIGIPGPKEGWRMTRADCSAVAKKQVKRPSTSSQGYQHKMRKLRRTKKPVRSGGIGRGCRGGAPSRTTARSSNGAP